MSTFIGDDSPVFIHVSPGDRLVRRCAWLSDVLKFLPEPGLAVSEMTLAEYAAG